MEPPEEKVGVELQKSSWRAPRPVNGWPSGSPGAAVADGSNRLASSLSVGNRQPKRFPVVLRLQIALASLKNFAMPGLRCHTNPVSLSSTASLFMFESTINRVLAGKVWSQDGVA